MGIYKEYEDLLSKTYAEVILFLLQKYGSAQDDFFREKSYQRFMNGEIKRITKGKYSRTSEGLYCHHIDENAYLNLSNQFFIEENQLSFEFQKKERLVYCDLIEHNILHALITQETSQEYGYLGYDLFLKPMIEEWFIDEKIPKLEWMKNCYHKSFLIPEEAVNILNKMEKKIGRIYPNTPLEYHEEKERRREEFKQSIIDKEKRLEQEYIERQKQLKISQKEWRKEDNERFYRDYPNFKDTGMQFHSPRLKIVALLYDYKYKETYKSKKELDSAMKPIIRDKLVEELYEIISNVEEGKR
ncbi:hypothetical protein [Planococcus versutus]|uniref:Uncharacterized protein n=1 Tax=Planococcus versutus TaxID=1302659 RepID=A0A1B1S504_9BACL|nr:hypothetical protein [Planococcus versutus]ANU28271.1 hypothetical protein I858_014865 [Planococcus versutus]